MAAAHPDLAALKVPRGLAAGKRIDYLTLTFAELDAEVDAWCLRLREGGVTHDQRVLVMVRQGLPLIACVFALFKLGAIPVVIDPGMGLKSFLKCVRHTEPDALVGIPAALVVSQLFRPSFRSVKHRVRASSNACARLAKTRRAPNVTPLPRAPRDSAAILFTSGSTGAPKGVCYEHGMFEAQVELIRETYDIRPGEIDLPMLPIFALFNPALGMTTIVPEINPSRPAEVDPAKIVRAILQEGVTNSFGSPTLWNKISLHCVENDVTLPSLKRVLCAGAPVPSSLWLRAPKVFTGGSLRSPYGATEALPLSSISHHEVDTTTVQGACVGHPIKGINVRIIPLQDGALKTLDGVSDQPTGEIGEIVVSGPVVTREYFRHPEATGLAKVSHQGVLWHRMGDLGYFDAAGRLWFCGRKVEAVFAADRVYHTEPVEQVFRLENGVVRCALVGLGDGTSRRPALVVQTEPGLSKSGQNDLVKRLRARAVAHTHTAAVREFFFHPAFPVDVRHNAKIHRLTLAKWAATQTPILAP